MIIDPSSDHLTEIERAQFLGAAEAWNAAATLAEHFTSPRAFALQARMNSEALTALAHGVTRPKTSQNDPTSNDQRRRP